MPLRAEGLVGCSSTPPPPPPPDPDTLLDLDSTAHSLHVHHALASYVHSYRVYDIMKKSFVTGTASFLRFSSFDLEELPIGKADQYDLGLNHSVMSIGIVA